MASDVQKSVLRRLLSERVKEVVTSVSLQGDLAKYRDAHVDDATIRKFLKARCCSWLPRSQKPKYSIAQSNAGIKFAKQILRLSVVALNAMLDLCLDGVVLSMPPIELTERFNYVWGGETYMWRKHGEANLPALAGHDERKKQAPLHRAIPVWGGVSEYGAAAVLWHPTHTKLIVTSGTRQSKRVSSRRRYAHGTLEIEAVLITFMRW